jgi:hypothetical protein
MDRKAGGRKEYWKLYLAFKDVSEPRQYGYLHSLLQKITNVRELMN